MVKLAEWPRKPPLVSAPRVHVDVHTARATSRPPQGHEPTIYDYENEAWEGDDDDAA